MMLPTRYSWLRSIKSVIEVATKPALIVSQMHAGRRRQNASAEAGKTVRPFTTAAQTSSVESVVPCVMKGRVMRGMIPHMIPTAKRHRSQNCCSRASSVIALLSRARLTPYRDALGARDHPFTESGECEAHLRHNEPVKI